MADQDIQSLQSQLQQLQEKLQSFDKKFSLHQHTGNDGSVWLDNTNIFLRNDRAIVSGCGGILGHKTDATDRAPLMYKLGIITGPDSNRNSGNVGNASSNAQLTIEKQGDGTEGILNLGNIVPVPNTFFYEVHNGIFIDCSKKFISVATGQTVFTDSDLNINDGISRVNYYFFIKLISGVKLVYAIIGNTVNSVTLKSAITLPAGDDGKVDNYTIFAPIYLGSADFPWRRIYTDSTVNGGVRFGVGSTSNGQNSLLWVDSTTGVLMYRDFSGVTTSISGSSFLGSKVSAYLAAATNLGGALVPIVFDTVNWDTNSEFNATFGTFTAASTGYYNVKAQVTVSAVLAGTGVNLAVCVNGTVVCYNLITVGAAGFSTNTIETDVHLVAGQIVAIYGATDIPPLALQTGANYCNLSIHRI